MGRAGAVVKRRVCTYHEEVAAAQRQLWPCQPDMPTYLDLLPCKEKSEIGIL